MIYSIDGTGPWNDKDYKLEMDIGFCKRITQLKEANFYHRGPSNDGLSTFDLSKILVSRVRSDRQSGIKDSSINLMGHSRGGAACIHAAYLLKNIGVKVNSLILFDAVDRTLQVSNQLNYIPSNVKTCLHFVRYEPFSNFFRHTVEYKNLEKSLNNEKRLTLKVAASVSASSSRQHVKLDNLTKNELSFYELEFCHKKLREISRFEVPELMGFGFGNTGLKAEPGVSMVLEPISATHGAMGGSPVIYEKYIPYEKYRKIIEYADNVAMKKIETMANCFLKLVGESGIPSLRFTED